MSSNSIYYVYLLLDPRSGEPFYVGKGKSHRATSHLMKSSLRSRSLKNNTIKSIIKEGKLPEIQYYATNLMEDKALQLEHQLILQYGRRDLNTGILCNHTDGGEGFGIRRCFTPEHRAKLSAMRTLNNLTNNPSKTSEWQAQKSKMQKGRPSPMQGKRHTPESIAKMLNNRSKPRQISCQYCNKGIPENRLHLHLEACEINPDADLSKVELKLQRQQKASIAATRIVECECCKQNIPFSAYKKYHGSNCRPRVRINGQNFITLKEAAASLSIPPQTIADQLKGRTKNFNDRIWEAHYL